jgi:hypothetical protein
MGRRPLGPKSSAGELWTEVERLREGSDDERFAELTTELERARARETAALSEVAAARATASRVGIAGESVGGKPALSKYRATWAEFADAVMNLPEVRRVDGWAKVRETVARDLAADLRLFELDAPRGRIEARRRDRLRRQLDSRAWLRCITTSEPWGATYRATFLQQVVRCYFRPSVWRIFEKASDEGIRDGLGVVYK